MGGLIGAGTGALIGSQFGRGSGRLAAPRSAATAPGDTPVGAGTIPVLVMPAGATCAPAKPDSELSVIAIEPGLENLLVQSLAPGASAALEPGVADYVLAGATDAANSQEESGVAACLLVPDRIRVPLARMLKKAAPRLRVLGHSEIPETQSIRIGRIIGESK
jgi:hypothetical protein